MTSGKSNGASGLENCALVGRYVLMMTLEEVKSGDHVTYHGERGEVEFVVANPTGDPAMDWYVEQFPVAVS
jgi:hypothetical protein